MDRGGGARAQVGAERRIEVAAGRQREVVDERSLVGIAHLDRHVQHVRGRPPAAARAGAGRRGRSASSCRPARRGRPRRVPPRCDRTRRPRARAASRRARAGRPRAPGSRRPRGRRPAGRRRRRRARGRRARPSRRAARGCRSDVPTAVRTVRDASASATSSKRSLLVPQEVRVRRLSDEAGTHEPDAQARPLDLHRDLPLERCNDEMSTIASDDGWREHNAGGGHGTALRRPLSRAARDAALRGRDLPPLRRRLRRQRGDRPRAARRRLHDRLGGRRRRARRVRAPLPAGRGRRLQPPRHAPDAAHGARVLRGLAARSLPHHLLPHADVPRLGAAPRRSRHARARRPCRSRS